MPAINRVRRADLLTLLVILFAAALARLSDPGIAEFKLDEAWLSRLAREFANGGPLPLLGMQSSVGVPNPPTSVYVMALPYALSSDPVLATMFVAALNVAGVGLLWLLAHRYLGPTVALVSGLMYALSPWAVYYSRKIWAQDFHTPFVLAALLLGLLGFREGRRWAQVACLPLLVFALQIHFAAWALLPLYVWLLWTGRRRIWWPGLAISLVLAALTLAPYLVGLAQSGGSSGDIASVIGGVDVAISDLALRHAANLTTGLGLAPEIAGDEAQALLDAVTPPDALWLLLGLAALLGLVAIWTARYHHMAATVALWALLPVVVFAVPWTDVYPHYLIASIPALCLLTGVGLDWLIRQLPVRPVSRSVVLVAFAAVMLTQFIWWRGVVRYVAAGNVESFGAPLAALMPIRDALLESDAVVMVTRDARLRYSTPPAIWQAMLFGGDRCFGAVSGDDVALYPNSGFALLVAPDGHDIRVDGYAPGEGQRFPAQPLGDYLLYPAASADSGDDWQNIETARFANDVTLTGYALDDTTVRLRWQTPRAINTQYQYFIHLLDASEERIGQYDGPFLDGFYWCERGTVVTRQPLERVAEAAVLRVGMYRLVDGGFANADRIDEAGNAVAPWVDVPLR